MKTYIAIAAMAAAAASFTPAAEAAVTVTLNPSSDGSLYTCAGCNAVSDGDYLMASGYIQGAVKFASAPIHGTVTQALLSVNPYGLPLWGSDVAVYGYGTADGQLVAADANAGTFLGTLHLPANLGYGQDAFFDVTGFVAAAHAPYLAFNLRSSGTDVFSSLEYNYGHAAQLLVSSVPEPSQPSMLAAGLLAMGLLLRRRNG